MPFRLLDVPAVAGWEAFPAMLVYRGETVSGDAIFEEVQRTDGKHLFLLVDVMGHGQAANTLVQELLVTYLTDPICDNLATPAELLVALQASMQNEFSTSGRFVAALAILVDNQGNVTVSNAGIPEPWLGLPVAGWVPWQVLSGPLVGLPVSKIPYTNARVTLPPDWKLLVFTDGVTESGARHQPIALFQTGPLPAFLAGLPAGLPPGQVVTRLLQALQIHAGTSWPEDDTTILCLHRR